jgi:hypothetical protein
MLPIVRDRHKNLKVAYNGGIVQAYDNAKKADFNKDSVYTILESGEIVIPKRYSELVLKFLKSKGIRFGNIAC